ncbi:MAG: T9SS type A sorting domain-containing protein, partial [Candidatus Cloacimonetes bacterium]|nr:T9SS type A sorting domain-containing protein [Candidatus Cloacimonadota bacterium]
IEFVGTLIPTYDVIPGVPEELDPATDVTITGAGFIGANLVTEGYTPVPNPTFVATSEGILQLVGTGEVSLTFDFDPAVDWFVYLEGGEWIAVAGPLPTYTVIVDLGAKDGTFEYKAGSGEDPTLPVELSVFNATLTAQNFVKLSWTSESETNMLGYRVYRAESEVQAEAILITPIMIQATNTSTTQNYSIEDREVNIGTTYYYWLEAVDYSHSSFFGHRSVEVLGEITPELPVQSVMSNAYPNPFRASSNTTIEVKVRADETGTVTIYNVLGQAVKTYTVSEGNHKLTWNGRDSRGNLCGSGIYFARMSTPSMNQTKKMVIVK